MTPISVAAIAFLIVFAVYFGGKVARTSERLRPIHGGPLARGFHFAACAVFTSILPTVLIEVFILRSISPVFILLGAIFAIFACLFAYALVEQPALARVQVSEDTGWTAEDARTSGL